MSGFTSHSQRNGNRYCVYSGSNSFICTLPDTFDDGGESIHVARNHIKVFDSEIGRINVKKFCVPPIGNRILYSLGIRKSKAERAYQNACGILENGFDTPEPLGYIIERSCGLIEHSYFFTKQVDGVETISAYKKDKKLMRALVEYTAEMHDKGMLHRDYSGGNVLFSHDDAGYHFMLVDINRFVFKNVDLASGIKSLSRLSGDKKMLTYCAIIYARKRGLDRRKCVSAILCALWRRNSYFAIKRKLKKIPGARHLT